MDRWFQPITKWYSQIIKSSLISEFQLTSSYSRATAFISGLGYYELYINGQKVGPNKLDPGYTHYAVR